MSRAPGADARVGTPPDVAELLASVGGVLSDGQRLGADSLTGCADGRRLIWLADRIALPGWV